MKYENKLTYSILKMIGGVAAFLWCLSSYAQDSEEIQIKMCRYQSGFAKNIATDRDDGLSYKNRIAKNNRLAYDNPRMRDWLGQYTKVIYYDLKKETPEGIGEATLIACLKSM